MGKKLEFGLTAGGGNKPLGGRVGEEDGDENWWEGGDCEWISKAERCQCRIKPPASDKR